MPSANSKLHQGARRHDDQAGILDLYPTKGFYRLCRKISKHLVVLNYPVFYASWRPGQPSPLRIGHAFSPRHLTSWATPVERTAFRAEEKCLEPVLFL